ncbi:MAG: SRPBCC family protein [Polyangiales bacterium]
MPTINSSTKIKAPVDKVFAYVTDPTNLAEWMVGITEVKDVTGSGVGQHHHWTYKMVGIPLHGETTTSECVSNERWVTNSKGGATSIFTFTFAPHEGGTKLNVDIDYTIPIPVLGNLAEQLVLKRNQRDMDVSMENLKDNMEA